MFTRRQFLRCGAIGFVGAGVLVQSGCRSNQTAQVIKPGDKAMVGSHTAGSEVYEPLVDQALEKLLARHSQGIHPAGFNPNMPQQPPGGMKICFVGVQNKSIEELGDFKEQLFEQIDAKIISSQVYQPVSRRFVEAGLRQCRLQPDELLIPQNMQAFTQMMQQMQQPFDYLLFATITSGTTRSNKDYQRNYLLTLEMVNINNGQADKELAEIAKKYNASAMAKIKSWSPF